MKYEAFGKLPSGEAIGKYTVENELCSLSVMNFGAIVTDFCVYGRNIVGGFDTLSDYLADTSHQGGTIGRVANRVADAKFTMNGKEYNLPKNNGKNCLHGGVGFDRRIWEVTEHSKDRIKLEYTSADGEEGFPSRLDVSVTYTLLECGFAIEYKAIPDGMTPIALTNHTYFHLDGLGGTIEEHKVQIFADTYTEVGAGLIPTGNRPEVTGTPFDLREPRVIADCLSESFIGHDHNFNLNVKEYGEILGNKLGLGAVVENSDLKLSVYTDQPGIQFYIGNFLGGAPDFRGGVPRVRHGALCLETQTEPNCINHGLGFYDKGDIYTHLTAYTVEKK